MTDEAIGNKRRRDSNCLSFSAVVHWVLSSRQLSTRLSLSLSLSVAGARSGGIEGAKERVIEASRIPRWN